MVKMSCFFALAFKQALRLRLRLILRLRLRKYKSLGLLQRFSMGKSGLYFVKFF